VLDLARVLATVSPSFGATCTPDALLTACEWSLPYSASKIKDTNTLLALRAFANLFLSPAGRKNMQGMKVDEWLQALRRERSWEEVGARKLPYTTIALK
jgi:phospholipase A-2-activating protein